MARYTEELGSFGMTLDGTILMASPQTLEMTGYDLFDLLGHHFAAYIAEESLPSAMDHFGRTLNGEETEVELDIRRKDGQLVRIRARSSADRENGEVVGVVGTIELVKAQVGTVRPLTPLSK